MSLLKQLFLAICLFLIVAYSGSFVAGIESSRGQMIDELRSHAQDAASALGLSLAPHIDDQAMLELMVSSIFDSGYYAHIRLVRIADGTTIVERKDDPNMAAVPAWFARLVNLQAQEGNALIMKGWQQEARVEVASHPRFALLRLWESALATLLWLLLCGLFSAVIGGWLLRRQLRPLDDMVRQARAISRRELFTLDPLPRTPELRRVVMAMNRMVEKLKALFAEEASRSERLREEVYQDSLTGLANRRLLDLRLDQQLDSHEHNSDGHLMVIRINDLAGVNQRFGAKHTDELICATAELLKQTVAERGKSDWLAARNRGGEFVLLAPGIDNAEARALAQALEDSFASLLQTGATDLQPPAHMGITAFQPGDASEQVIGRADQALATAQSDPSRAWKLLDGAEMLPSQDLHEWSLLLDEALEAARFQLYFQPVVSCTDRHQVLHHKVLARLVGRSGELLVAGRFLPWLERLGWTARFDRVIFGLCLAHLRQSPRPLALSLSSATLRDPASVSQVLQRLRANPSQAQCLHIEIDDRALLSSEELERLSNVIRDAGCQLALQHFGGRFSLVGNLSQLGLAYLKIDGSFIRGLDTESDKRPFIEALVRATRSIDLPLIAEQVEREGELEVLCELGVHAATGQLLGGPSPHP
jgi:diguanylate cyclase (GGDEF)-like protein